MQSDTYILLNSSSRVHKITCLEIGASIQDEEIVESNMDSGDVVFEQLDVDDSTQTATPHQSENNAACDENVTLNEEKVTLLEKSSSENEDSFAGEYISIVPSRVESSAESDLVRPVSMENLTFESVTQQVEQEDLADELVESFSINGDRRRQCGMEQVS